MAKKRSGTWILSSLAGRIVIIFLAVLIPIYALLVISTTAYLWSLREQAGENAQSILDLSLAELDAELDRIDRYYYNLQEGDVNFQRLIRWADSSADRLAYYRVYRDIVDQNNLSSYSESLYLYLEKVGKLLLASNISDTISRDALYEALASSYAVRQPVLWSIYTVDDIPYLIHTVGYSGVYVGALIDLNAVMDMLKNQIPYENVEIWLDYQESNRDESIVIRSSEVHGTKQKIFIALDANEIASAMPVINRVILMIGLILIIILPMILIFLFMRMIVHPARIIVEGMYHLASGEADYRIPDFNAADEFVGIRNSFNNMASEIQHFKILQYEEKLEREQMLLQNLLLQIRPHFLLNFLNQIFSMAELEDYAGIKRSSLYLSKFFRYLSRSDRIATLRSELELVDAYLEIMEEQYMDCFFVERKIDPDLLSYRIPPLIVHNFVENIFKYAVSDCNMVIIRLMLEKENDYVVMTISDDGPGVEESILQTIREAQPVEKSDGTHIGIYNSAYRLKKLCGDDCILDIQSVLTEGTCVRIMLPVRED